MSQLCCSFTSCLRIYSTANNHGLRILSSRNPFYHRVHSNFMCSVSSGSDSGTSTDEEDRPGRGRKKVSLNSGALSQLLGMPRPYILKLMSKRPAIRSTNPDYLSGTSNVFKTFGFQSEELLQYPELFMMTPNAVENYVLIFKESGFKELRAHYVLNYRELIKKSIHVLKNAGLIPRELNVVQHYCDQLQLKKNCEKEMWAALPENYEQSTTLAEVRVLIMKYFLMSGLNCDLEAAEKIIKTYRRFNNRSYNWLKQNLQIVAERFKLPLEKVFKHSYILLTNPVNSLEMLDKLPVLGGRPIAEVINLRPKILTCQVTALQEITRLFDQHGITTKAIAKYPEVYTLSPTTVKTRLEDFETIPEFGVLKSHPRVGRLIYYQNKIKKRLEYLQTTHQVYNSSLHILSSGTEHFETYLRHGEMRPKGDDNVHFVSTYLNLPKREVRNLLMVQPHWRDISPVPIKSVLNYLTRTKSFTVEQLKQALPVVLYPLDKVMAHVRLVQESNEATETDLYFLQMVLYFMEKKGHFSGAGVWNNENKVERKTDPENVEHKLPETATISGSVSVYPHATINDNKSYASSTSNLVSSNFSRAIAIDDHVISFDDADDVNVTEFVAGVDVDKLDKIDFDKLELGLEDDEEDFGEDAIVVGKYGKSERRGIDDLALHRLL